MSQVGQGFGTFYTQRRFQTPMEDNPMDRCTIVSAYPKKIISHKPTISPGYFEIPAAKKGDFSSTVIGPSSWWKETGEDEPLMEVLCPSYQVAHSIVNDFINALFAGKGHDQKPAIFVCLGEYTKEELKKSYKDKVSGKPFGSLLQEALDAQKRYYEELVKQADILWARSNKNPLSIANEARMAALELGLKENKEWLLDFKTLEMENCKACGTLINPGYPICPNCKAVTNELLAKERGIKFAS